MKWFFALLLLLAAPSAQAQTPFACCSQVCAPVAGQATPVVYPIAIFTVARPVVFDQLIGTVAVVNGTVSAMSIVCGDPGNPSLKPPGYFAIYPASEHLRTSGSVDGQAPALPPSGVYNLMISATNSAGTTIAPITVIVP